MSKTKWKCLVEKFQNFFSQKKGNKSQKFIFILMHGSNKRSFILKQTCSF